MKFEYSYDYKLPSWCMKRVAAQQSAAQHNTTSYYRHGILICFIAYSGDVVVAQSRDMTFESMMRQPVQLIASSPVTSVKVFAAFWDRGRSVRSAMEKVPFEYVVFHTQVVVHYSPTLRAKALRAIARAYR